MKSRKLRKLNKQIRNIIFFVAIVISITAHSQIQLMEVDVKDQESAPEISGFTDIPAQELPLSTSTYSSQKRVENNIQRLSDLTTLDASVTDSYNATGYWDILSVRGYTLDNRYSFRREGLPISAETSIPLDNKDQIEILKGLGGVQAGASSPGGLVNYLVKRPTGKTFQAYTTQFTDSGDALLGVDAGGNFNSNETIGYRVNAAAENLRPHLNNANGERSLLSGAVDWHLPHESLVQAEVEWSRRSQPSQAGFSLLGNRLPSVGDVNLNLNNQSWTEPVIFSGLTSTLKFSQALDDSWSWSAIAGVQVLGTDDRMAYPFGCTKENVFDRFCSDGTYDMYDYRSENESRVTQAARLSLDGQAVAGAVKHNLSFSLLGSGQKERYEKQTYNYAGEGNVNGTGVGAANPTPNDQNTNRDAGALEFSLSDAMKWNRWRLWLGFNANYVDRKSIRTDGSEPTSYAQSFIIPWGALSYDFEKVMAYISAGDGMESFVTPNKPGYNHAGEFLSDVRSHQIEIGLRGEQSISWNLAAFQITRPVVTDQQPSYEVDGVDEHRGIEGEVSTQLRRWDLDASIMVIDARRHQSDLSPSVNGERPVNVPNNTARIGVSYKIPDVTGLTVSAHWVHEGERAVLPDNSINLPEWDRIDAGLSYRHTVFGTKAEAKLLVENLMDRRYWRESPTQYGHVYLYPGESRNITLTLQAAL